MSVSKGAFLNSRATKEQCLRRGAANSIEQGVPGVPMWLNDLARLVCAWSEDDWPTRYIRWLSVGCVYGWTLRNRLARMRLLRLAKAMVPSAAASLVGRAYTLSMSSDALVSVRWRAMAKEAGARAAEALGQPVTRLTGLLDIVPGSGAYLCVWSTAQLYIVASAGGTCVEDAGMPDGVLTDKQTAIACAEALGRSKRMASMALEGRDILTALTEARKLQGRTRSSKCSVLSD